MVVPTGFEPIQGESKSLMLPLHQGTLNSKTVSVFPKLLDLKQDLLHPLKFASQ